MSSVLWHCWLGVRKSIRPVKKFEWCWVMTCWRGYQSAVQWDAKLQMICIWSSWCHCDAIVSSFIKIQTGLTFLVLAYPRCPGKHAVKWLSVCSVCYCSVCENDLLLASVSFWNVLSKIIVYVWEKKTSERIFEVSCKTTHAQSFWTTGGNKYLHAPSSGVDSVKASIIWEDWIVLKPNRGYSK